MLEHMQGRDDANLEILFELLKVYQMLGLPEKMDARIAAAWIQKDWERSFALEPQVQAQFRVHLNKLLHGRAYEPIRLNEELIANVRRKLNALSSAELLYVELKNKTSPDHSHDFRLQDALGPRAAQVFGPDVRTLMIPGLYTYDGYYAVFKTQGPAVIEAVLKRHQTLENSQVDQSSDGRRLYSDLQTLYFADYAKTWRNLLRMLHVKQPQDVHEAIQILGLLSGHEASLLKTLLAAVERNTSLTRAPTADSSDKQPGQSGNTERGRSLEMAQRPLPSDSSLKPAHDLEKQFEDLNTLVRSSGNAPPPLDNVLSLLNEVRGSLLQISNDAKNQAEAQRILKGQTSDTSASDVFGKAEREFSRLPEPLQGWLLSFTTFGKRAARKAVESTLATRKSELNALWKKEVLQPYSTGLDGRYPLFPNSQNEVPITDFGRFFAPNGIIDQFFQTHLKPFVDTTTTKWQPAAIDKHTIDLSKELLQQLQYAERIRKTFFAAGGSTPSVQFELEPISLDENVSLFTLHIEGQPAQYNHGPIRPSIFRWPGPEPAAGVRLQFQTHDGKNPGKSLPGPWAWLRTLDNAIVERMGQSERFKVTFRIDGYKAEYELRAMSVDNPFQLMELQNFRCPGSL
jgi:type VI secretion system protein ImpL